MSSASSILFELKDKIQSWVVTLQSSYQLQIRHNTPKLTILSQIKADGYKNLWAPA